MLELRVTVFEFRRGVPLDPFGVLRYRLIL